MGSRYRILTNSQLRINYISLLANLLTQLFETSVRIDLIHYHAFIINVIDSPQILR